MKSAVRVVVIVLAVVVVLLGLVAGYLLFVFDPNDYRDRIASEVEKHTGRSLSIEGDIGLSVFPWLGVEIGPTKLGNAPGFGEAPFASVGEVEVRARLMPLLRSEIEVDRIVLRGMELDLVRDAQGRGNWEDLAARGGEDAGQSADTSAGEAAGAAAAIVVAGVQIESARVSFDDRQAGSKYVVDKLSLKSGEIRPGARFPLELGFDVASSAPEVKGRLDLSGEVLFDLQGPKVDIEGLKLRFDGNGSGLPGGKAAIALNAGVAVDLSGAGTVSVKGLALKAYGIDARGELAGSGLNTAPAFSGKLDVPDIDPRSVLTALGIEAPKVADANVLKRASAGLRFDATTTSAKVHDLKVVLDESTLLGELSVEDFARQSLRFDLALDGINVDRYLPPVEKGEKPATPAATPGAAAAAIDPAVLRGLDVIGKLKVGRLVVSGATVSDILVEVRAQGGVLKLAPLSASLYDGKYAGNVSVDGRGQALAVSLDESLTGVQVGPLLRDLSGAEERLTGNANVKARLQARGNDPDAMKRTLAGNVDFRFLDGAVKGINVAQYLREAQARISGKPVPATNEPNQTDFTALTGTVQIAEGVARNEDLDARSPLLRIGGRGSVNLPAERIDYVVRASVVASLSGQGGEGLENLKGVTVPIKVSGTFDKPSYALDLENLVTDRVKQQAKEKLQEKLAPQLQEKLSPQLQEGLQKGFGGLLGR